MRTDLAAWMTPVLIRMGVSCAEDGWIRARADGLRSHVLAVADSMENGRELLKTAALERLTGQSPEMIDRAISCIFVLGTADDLDSIRPLLNHEDSRVQKVARVCVFELERKGGA